MVDGSREQPARETSTALLKRVSRLDDPHPHVMVEPMRENQRDSGLARAVGPWAFAASIVSMIVGAGIFAVPAALAACVGPSPPASARMRRLHFWHVDWRSVPSQYVSPREAAVSPPAAESTVLSKPPLGL